MHQQLPFLHVRLRDAGAWAHLAPGGRTQAVPTLRYHEKHGTQWAG